MSNYIVDGSDLTSVANAIRAKSGGSGQLAFPSGFVSEIGNIPSGGGGDYTAEDFWDYTKPEGNVTSTLSYFGPSTLQNSNQEPSYFSSRSKITSVYLPNYNNTSSAQTNFRNMAGLKYAVLANLSKTINSVFANDSALIGVDIRGGGSLGQQCFLNCSKLAVLIIRSGGLTSLGNINSFQGTRFASGKAGGTLYVPQFLMASFQSASNWSTILGYATNNIVALEGSPYESKYVDGVTDIPTKTITQNLTNCTSSYTKSILYINTGYQITLTPDAGYTMSSVVITRDGTDISSIYDSSTGKATFTCFGNVVITATATAS